MSNYIGKMNDISYYARAPYSPLSTNIGYLFEKLLPLVVYQERKIIYLELLYPLLTPRNTEDC